MRSPRKSEDRGVCAQEMKITIESNYKRQNRQKLN